MSTATMTINIWPHFPREEFKSKVVIVVNSFLIGLVIASLCHSYKTKSLRQTKIQMVIIHIMIIISILNPPAEEIGEDHEARATSK